MKKILAGIIACCVVGGVMPSVDIVANNAVITASAEDETAEYTEGTYEQLTYKNYGDHIEISGCDDSATEVVIPSEIDGLPVTGIGEYAFYEHTSLKSIEIPDSVISIGVNAFNYCTSLASIKIPDSVTNIENNPFYGSLWFKEQRKENPLVIVNNILIDGTTCSGDVVIPDGVTSITEWAFQDCSKMTSIIIPNSVINIGEDAFHMLWVENSALTSVIMSKNVTEIKSFTFSGCSNLKSITIPENVESIGMCAFDGCLSLESITIPNSVKDISLWAFSTCKSLTSLEILNPKCCINDNVDTISNGKNENGEYYFDGVICGYENSTAQEYAEKYGYKFESLGEAPKTSVTETLPGDANGDGIVTIADAAAIIQHLGNPDKYSLSGQNLINADCYNTGDGVTALDALAIQKLEAKMIFTLPEMPEIPE